MDGILSEVFTDAEWDKIVADDPTYRIFESSAWQDPAGLVSTYPGYNLFDMEISFGSDAKKGKPAEHDYRTINQKCWKKYREFGPISAAVNSKADYVAAAGFRIYSDDLMIDRFLFDLVYSLRNRLYQAVIGWMVRMQAEGELFLLIAFDAAGNATIRTLEPCRIVGHGDGCETGLITDPEDATRTLFYSHKYSEEYELIPDISLMFDPDLSDRMLTMNLKGYDDAKAERSRGKGFAKLGGYRRFLCHWKNLTGIHEFKRDISPLRTVLEALNLYWMAIKWELDHKKAQSSYTNEINFADSPQGRIAWGAWKKMTPEEKAETGLTKTLSPGSRVFTAPGMSLEVHSPQLSKLSGENQDLLNVAGAGARTPQDLFQGQSAGATHASIKATRGPLVQEIESLDYKLEHFLKFELLRACFYAKGRLSDFPKTFKKTFVKSMAKGKPTFVELDVEPAELVKLSFPKLPIVEEPDGKANAFLGSKHSGVQALGISHATIAKEFGVDVGRERRAKAVEEEEFGEVELTNPDIAGAGTGGAPETPEPAKEEEDR